MVLSLLFGKKYEKTSVGGIFLDATLNENHQYNSRVTNYPVEDGRIISDHVINEPETVQITGIVTDTPISLLTSFNRSVDAFNRLVRLHTNRELVTVVTGIKVYTNMVMTSLQVPKNVQTGQSLTFIIDLQKVFLDSSVRLSLDPNNPFNKAADKIPREIVNDANVYPYLQQDPVTSLKDQASSKVDVGIQDLLPVPTNILPNILDGVSNFAGFV
jgi:hypothetical protein